MTKRSRDEPHRQRSASVVGEPAPPNNPTSDRIRDDTPASRTPKHLAIPTRDDPPGIASRP